VHSSKKVIAIIGGGFCGMMTAIQLKLQSTKPLHVLIFESSSAIGRGTAYSGYSINHLLNVEARNMSAFPDEPDHFVKWAEKTYGKSNPEFNDVSRKFLPRLWYGEYLNELAKHTLQPSDELFTCTVINSRVEAGFILHSESGVHYTADFVVLATGNFPPSKPKGIPLTFTESKRYCANPWKAASVEGCSDNEPVLIAGTGLTMVDVVQGLREKGFTGKIIALSPKGFEILPHRRHDAKIDLEGDVKQPYQLGQLFTVFKKHIRKVRSEGITGEAVVDAIRPKTPSIWKALSHADRVRFLSHVRHLWGLARHRLPAEVHTGLREQIEGGLLEIVAGRILDIHDESSHAAVTWRDRKTGTIREQAVQRVINCTGPATDITKTADPLFVSLLRQGLICSDALHMGIECNEDFEVLNQKGEKIGMFYALGALLKGQLWESTAIPELRLQTKAVAQSILSDSAF
jgi:uncharacterized NAD(P)/FAD-binding protein YdhS